MKLNENRGRFINFAEVGEKFINFVEIGGILNMHHWLKGGWTSLAMCLIRILNFILLNLHRKSKTINCNGWINEHPEKVLFTCLHGIRSTRHFCGDVWSEDRH